MGCELWQLRWSDPVPHAPPGVPRNRRKWPLWPILPTPTVTDFGPIMSAEISVSTCDWVSNNDSTHPKPHYPEGWGKTRKGRWQSWRFVYICIIIGVNTRWNPLMLTFCKAPRRAWWSPVPGASQVSSIPKGWLLSRCLKGGRFVAPRGVCSRCKTRERGYLPEHVWNLVRFSIVSFGSGYAVTINMGVGSRIGPANGLHE